MARYPTFEEYAQNGNFQDGIKRCDDLLKKSPKNVQILVVKLQLLAASKQDGTDVLEQLLEAEQALGDVQLITAEMAVFDGMKDVYPPPLTVGPVMAKLWDITSKSTNSSELQWDLAILRFSRAVLDNRTEDAQQALITMKALAPKNRLTYMAHVAYTQLLSTSKDDLHSRLALLLAKKAVSEKFDEDKSLDCRVPGQIFAIQGSEKDLDSIRERRFRESKQVYHALKLSAPVALNGAELPPGKPDPKTVPSRQWLSAELESLKQDFSHLVKSSASLVIVKAFVDNAQQLFQAAITSLDLAGRDRGAADACFLAISGLVKLYADSGRTGHLLQAAFLAERLLKHNEHIHEARLILVYLYMRLGLGSLAMQRFESLRVKEIQHDTVGHVLFSQLSVTQPFRTRLTPKGWYDPHQQTHKALGVYPRHEDKLSGCEASVLDDKQTGMIFDLHELRVSLRDSLVRRMFALEHRRICRLTGQTLEKHSDEVGPRVVANWTSTKDNRDFNAAFNYGFSVEEALFSHSGSRTGRAALLCDLVVDTAWTLANKQNSLVLDPENLQPAFTTCLSAEPIPAISSAQHLSTTLALQLLPLLKEQSDPSASPSKASITSLLVTLESLPIASLTANPSPLAETLTDHYIFLDILRIVLASCRFIEALKATKQAVPEELQAVQDRASELAAQIQGHANTQAAAVRDEDVRAKLVEEEGLAALFGKRGGLLDEFVKDVVASAKEGWEGVRRVDVS